MGVSKKTKTVITASLNRSTASRILIWSGVIAIVCANALLIAIFYPVLREEIGYRAREVTASVGSREAQSPKMTPVDGAFGIIIPKLGANAKIIPSVDPYDSQEYQQALARGVAHAKGTALPGETGNVFLFSHSSVNFYEANRYNSVFYLINKLETGDTIDLYYQGVPYTYSVTDKKLVAPTDVSYLTKQVPNPTLTLMTCWPPGTTLKRLLVFGELDASIQE